ncbi:MAG: RluA family pseudouridine synthase [Eubacteriales bacterium]
MKLFQYIVEKEQENQRIDKCIHSMLTDVSRSYIQKVIKDGYLFVNNVSVKSNYKVKIDDEIKLELPDAIIPDIIPEDITLDILFEDKDVIVINKPKGMVVHPAAGHYSGTLVNAVMFYCGDSLSGINGVMRPGIVHRIDKDTTGSIIICKNDFSHNEIASQLKEHTITRKYLAICQGVISEEEGIVNAPIGRHHVERKKMAINHNHGKDAITHYKVLKRFEKFTYIECQLETGRTHQIRVHMASLGHPLLGDELYNHIPSKLKLQGQTLHAYILGFKHPTTGLYCETIAPIPDYFNHLLQIL